MREHDMASEPIETQTEYRVDAILRELDELCAFAVTTEGAAALEHSKIGIGQIMTRSQLLVSFLLARQPAQFKVINNGR